MIIILPYLCVLNHHSVHLKCTYYIPIKLEKAPKGQPFPLHPFLIEQRSCVHRAFFQVLQLLGVSTGRGEGDVPLGETTASDHEWPSYMIRPFILKTLPVPYKGESPSLAQLMTEQTTA